MKTQKIIKQVNEAIKKVFKTIPSGFGEYVYEEELEKMNIKFRRQKRLPFYYKGEYLCSYVPDLLIPTKDGDYILELKHKASLDKRDEIQLQRYLFGMNESQGSLINFQTRTVEDYELVKKNKNKDKLKKLDAEQKIIYCLNNAQESSDVVVWLKRSQIEQNTNINRNTLAKKLKNLVEKNVLSYDREKGYTINNKW